MTVPVFSLVLNELYESRLGTWHHWAFEGSLLAGAVRAATEHQLFPVVAAVHDQADDADIHGISRIIDGGVFGSIIRTPNERLERVPRVRPRQGHPLVVVFPRKLKAWSTNALDVDNQAIGRAAAQLLADRGRRRWLLVGYQEATEAQRLRCEGFAALADEVGAQVDSIRLPMDVDEQRTAALVAARMRKDRVDAVFALDSVCSVGSLMGCLEAGRKVGQDLDVVGCDCSMWKHHGMPRITLVDISWRSVGAVAVQTLVELARSGDQHFPTRLHPPRIVPGETCPVPERLAHLVT